MATFVKCPEIENVNINFVALLAIIWLCAWLFYKYEISFFISESPNFEYIKLPVAADVNGRVTQDEVHFMHNRVTCWKVKSYFFHTAVTMCIVIQNTSDQIDKLLNQLLSKAAQINPLIKIRKSIICKGIMPISHYSDWRFIYMEDNFWYISTCN